MQNEINLVLSPAQLQALDDALLTLENFSQTLPNPTPADKAALVKPPGDALGWITGMLTRAQQNLDRLPRDFDPALVQHDLDLVAALAPRQLRLDRLKQRIDDAVVLANSDAFADMLEVRRRLMDAKVSGVDDNLDEGMARFFKRPKRTKTPPKA